MNNAEQETEPKFSKGQSMFIGCIAMILSVAILQYLLTGDDINQAMSIPFLPYLIGILVGIATALRISKIREPSE